MGNIVVRIETDGRAKTLLSRLQPFHHHVAEAFELRAQSCGVAQPLRVFHKLQRLRPAVLIQLHFGQQGKQYRIAGFRHHLRDNNLLRACQLPVPDIERRVVNRIGHARDS